jgi:hypothetical protein
MNRSKLYFRLSLIWLALMFGGLAAMIYQFL